MKILTFSETQNIKSIGNLLDASLPNWRDNLLTLNEMLRDIGDDYEHIDYINAKISNIYNTAVVPEEVIQNDLSLTRPHSVQDVGDLNYWISIGIEMGATSNEIKHIFSLFYDIVHFCFDSLDLEINKYNRGLPRESRHISLDGIKLRVGRSNQYSAECDWSSKYITHHIPQAILKHTSGDLSALLPMIFQVRLSPRF